MAPLTILKKQNSCKTIRVSPPLPKVKSLSTKAFTKIKISHFVLKNNV
jgi:hypothetical protein